MKKKIDIENYNDFIQAGFKECKLCGWAFSPDFFEGHECKPYDSSKSDSLTKGIE